MEDSRVRSRLSLPLDIRAVVQRRACFSAAMKSTHAHPASVHRRRVTHRIHQSKREAMLVPRHPEPRLRPECLAPEGAGPDLADWPCRAYRHAPIRVIIAVPSMWVCGHRMGGLSGRGLTLAVGQWSYNRKRAIMPPYAERTPLETSDTPDKRGHTDLLHWARSPGDG